MYVNEKTAIYTKKIILVPYCEHHVPRYHEWMQDPDIRAATASELLSLPDEYAMQRSWRTDSDKLTFITCETRERRRDQSPQQHETATMVGDVNLFILANEEESGDVSLVGELELMIGRKENQYRGLGRAAVLTFLFYIVTHQEEILEEFFSTPRNISTRHTFMYLRVKVGSTNSRSINLFASLGFEKTNQAPDFFDEFEMRRKVLEAGDLEEMMAEKDVSGYAEVQYQVGEDEGKVLLVKSVETAHTGSASINGGTGWFG